MLRFPTIFALCLSAAPVVAETSKEESCGHQAAIVDAIRQARIDRVAERKVPEALAASDHSWPDDYSKVIPLIAPWVYEMKRADVRDRDLGAAWNELCLEQ